MMRGAVLAALIALWAGSALAQVVEVRAGEHDGFTRLVFRLPERSGYSLTRAADTARLSIERPALVFDTSVVFHRVPRSRLTAIDTPEGGGPVALSLACDCEIRTFWHGRSALVLDILDETPPSPADGLADAARSLALNPLPLPGSRSPVAARLVAEGLARQKRGSAPLSKLPMRRPALDDSRQELLKQLARAASQGLLSPRRPVPEPRQHNIPESREKSGPHPEKRESENPRPIVNLRAESSIDRDMGAALSGGARIAPAQRCTDPGLLDVTGWADDRPFPAQLVARRARLLKEFDKPDAAAVIALARTYIHFGFGAETRAVLAQMGGRSKPESMLLAMAAILEDGHDGDWSILAGQLDCAPVTALWSALSYAALPVDAPMDTDAILRGLSALPPHLRAYLGPMLARRFLDAGYTRDSDRIRRILERSAATVTPESELVTAEIALSRGDAPEAEDRLQSLARKNADPSAMALLRLITSRLERDAEISYETAQLAGAYATEHRGRPLGQALARAQLMALAASGTFEEAISGFEAWAEAGRPGTSALRSDLVDILIRRADDFDFLRHVTSRRLARPGTLEPDTANDLIERLLSLGFVYEAATHAAPEIGGPATRKRQLLRAEISLRNARPRQAELELVSLSGKDADLLRAKAKSAAGDHRAAGDLFERAGHHAAARRAAWLGEDWPELKTDKVPAVSETARATLSATTAMSGASIGVLERNRRLLKRSDETRGRVEALLSAWPVPREGAMP